MKRYLVLEDGRYFEGEAFGGNSFKVGELVFNTGMMGYQDILCDASYCGQIINLTYPLVGNYGINREGFESINTDIFGIIVGEISNKPNNWRSQMTVDEFLKLKNIPGIKGIDTRQLTRLIRNKGTQRAVFTDDISNLDQVIEKIKKSDDDKNLVERVSIQKPFRIPNVAEKIVLIDFGSINEILRVLNANKKDITVVPYDTSAEDILALHPDGVMLSNGPGNPVDVYKSIENCKKITGKIPVFGIGLGHQIIALAEGAKINKLKFGNRGANYPIKNMETGKVLITSKNNSYVVDEESLKNTGLRISYKGINAETVEGCIDEEKFISSIQFQPWINFDVGINENYSTFFEMIKRFKEQKNA